MERKTEGNWQFDAHTSTGTWSFDPCSLMKSDQDNVGEKVLLKGSLKIANGSSDNAALSS